MVDADRFTAQLLESGARGYAALATDRLFERRPDLEQPAGAAGSWRAHLAQRLAELQTATALGRPVLFLERVRWSRRAYQARSVPEADLRAALEALREVLAEELPELARVPALQVLDAALSDFEKAVEVEGRDLDPEVAVDGAALRYLLDVLEGRPRQAIDELLKARQEQELSLRDCVLRILLPAQREIGRLWHLGDSDVAEEHLVTSTTKRALAVLAHLNPPPASSDRVLLVSAVAGDDHDVGSQALSVLMEAEGWRCVDLGGDVPAEDLVAARVAFEPDVVVLSATLTDHLVALERSVRALRREAGSDIRIYAGGSAIAVAPELAEQWGADGSLPDLAAALDLLTAED